MSTPISVRRIVSYNAQRVTYWYNDYKSGRLKMEEVDVFTFIAIRLGTSPFWMFATKPLGYFRQSSSILICISVAGLGSEHLVKQIIGRIFQLNPTMLTLPVGGKTGGCHYNGQMWIITTRSPRPTLINSDDSLGFR